MKEGDQNKVVFDLMQKEAMRAQALTGHQHKRMSDPTHERTAYRPVVTSPYALKHPAALEGIAIEALEAGLNLEPHKDESTKDLVFAWTDITALRRGMMGLAAVGVCVLILGLASGHWYFAQSQSMEIFSRYTDSLAEYKFREDVDALGQTLALAHFTELAFGLHRQVDRFLDKHHLERGALAEALHATSQRSFQSFWDHVSGNATVNLTKQEAAAILIAQEDAAEAHHTVQLVSEGLREDMQGVLHDFSDSVDKFTSHVDELGDTVGRSASPELVYDMISSLITHIVRRASEDPQREHYLATVLRPHVDIFFRNYEVFVGRYKPGTAKPLETELLMELHNVWECLNVHQQPAAHLHNVNRETKCEDEFQAATIQERADDMPGGRAAYVAALKAHKIGDYVRGVFYIEHMMRLSRRALTHFYHQHRNNYRCTTCATEGEVIIQLLTLVQSRTVHPRWLTDPTVVADGVTLLSVHRIPENVETFRKLVDSGKVVSRLC